MKKIIQYRGRRIRYSNRNLLNFYRFFLLSPVLTLLGYFVGYKQIYPLVMESVQEWQAYVVPMVIIIASLIGSLLLINLLIKWSVIGSGYFSKVEQRQILSRMLIDHNYYTRKQIKTNDGKGKEKIKFPKVYFRSAKESIFISFETSGSKFQEKFESIGGFLETAFHADNIGITDEKGFIVYELVVDVYEKRISITDMKADKGKVQLMKGLYWYFDKDPHLLLGGGTGGGKTFTLLSLIYALCGVADIEICDPKNSDLMAVGKLPLFAGKVHTGKEAITHCLKTGVELMKSRYEMMENSPKYRMGKNYAYYGLKPKFIVIDELAAFKAELAGDYKTEGEFDEQLAQLVLKGRQCGIFLIVAMQRPDGEFIKTALRDNFMFRMSVGRLSEMGLFMIFGDENKNKKFKFVEKINGIKVYGRGYVARGGEIAREFYSPQVPDSFDFISELIKISDKLGYERVPEEVKVEVSKKIAEQLEKEAHEDMDNAFTAENEFLNELSSKFTD
ncbi:FtsK/SpoIIIE domain-containing protein [Enterococcus gallinarum]|uniref:FtsK/SpoIIIE domain-containing protein n=1 Tax=Enterococcus gallinarum TaxID=1353 RepID=UPI0018A92710|nr:FtsK/SpoIIIE domain-containing protein [Enterococcus gallinarum]